jgi:branched-subunit amino acid transport protein AzlD
MNDQSLYLWMLILLAFIATDIWRVLGVLLANHISPESLFMKWINAVAYAMVCGVMMLVVVHPSGLVASSALLARLPAFAVTIGLMLWRGNTLLAVSSGAITFVCLDILIGPS